MNSFTVALFASLVVFARAGLWAGHGGLEHGGWGHGGWGHGGWGHGGWGHDGYGHGHGHLPVVGASGVVSSGGAAGPTGIVNGHGAIGPNGIPNALHGHGHDDGQWHGEGLLASQDFGGHHGGHHGVSVVVPAGILGVQGYGHGLGIGLGHGHGHGHW